LDYRKAFEDFKTSIQQSMTLFHPDYTLQWCLKADAALGGALIQIK
jgi:hypothetical protein